MIRQMPAGHNDTGDVLCCIQKETGASKNDKARLGWNMARLGWDQAVFLCKA